MKSKKRNKINHEASLKSKVQAYVALFVMVVVVMGLGYWNYDQTKVPQVPRQTIREHLHKTLDPSMICMVKSGFMGKPQIPVKVNGKTYYGCCQSCITKLKNNEAERMAIDQFSGYRVDKSLAYIAFKNPYGNVIYFESEVNYKAFYKK